MSAEEEPTNKKRRRPRRPDSEEDEPITKEGEMPKKVRRSRPPAPRNDLG